MFKIKKVQCLDLKFCFSHVLSLGLLMSLPEGSESLQNDIAQLCELW